MDITEVPDFNKMYELYDPCTVMFFFRCAPSPPSHSPLKLPSPLTVFRLEWLVRRFNAIKVPLDPFIQKEVSDVALSLTDCITRQSVQPFKQCPK